ncbi:MAG TPA: alpha/beta hydrolase [Pseudomonadales bacterium]|nr:alpha/beta hydrolase [Pseudomonadales bacterium]
MLNYGPTSQRFMSQRLQLHYVDWGNSDKPTLVLLHGGRDHCRSWDWLAEALRHDWHVVCPDLRGHGDSAWSPDADYRMESFIYDFAQFIHQLDVPEVTIVAHSLGGMIASRFCGIYPEKVRRLVLIEGLSMSPRMIREQLAIPVETRMRSWIEGRRKMSARLPKRYDSIALACARMHEENSFLSHEQAYHLTIHGISRNEDGSFSWKFDNYLHDFPPYELPYEDVTRLWHCISCPTLLLYGEDSWASNPEQDGRLDFFQQPTFKVYPNAGHWLHHDQFPTFLTDVKAFIE